jgi:hypothetical protein
MSASLGDEDHFDLLPFVGVMLSLLGALLLITMSIASINIGAAASEVWLPQPNPSRHKLTAVLIEWDGKYATWQSKRGDRKLKENFLDDFQASDGTWLRMSPRGVTPINAPEPNALDPLIQYLESNRQSHYALFAVRPSGFETFRRMSSRFKHHNIQIGYEPVDQDKRVRLEAGKDNNK